MEEALIKRVLPHNTEAEQLVIGCMLMDKEAISAASEIIHSDDFYGRQYGAMFEAITELYNEGKPTDLVAVQEQLKTKDVPPESYSIAAFRERLIWCRLPLIFAIMPIWCMRRHCFAA